MRLAHDPGSEELLEEGQLGLARGLGPAGDLVDRAVVLAEPKLAVVVDQRLGEVARLVLQAREDAHPILEGRLIR